MALYLQNKKKHEKLDDKQLLIIHFVQFNFMFQHVRLLLFELWLNTTYWIKYVEIW